MQHWFDIYRYQRVLLFPIEFYSHDEWFYQLCHRLHLYLRALKKTIFEVIAKFQLDGNFVQVNSTGHLIHFGFDTPTILFL